MKEYIAIVIARPLDYRHVLAITFTNKAAGEMKERILKTLARIAEGKAPEIEALLVKDHSLSPEIIQPNAAQALAFILHDYLNFSVSTIDAFTHRIVRNFVHELNLPSQFDVETDQSNLTGRMVGLLMDLIGREPYITEMLVQFAQERLSQEAHWSLDNSLERTAGLLFSDESREPIRALHSIGEEQFPAFIDYLKGKRDFYLLRVKQLATAAVDLIEGAGLAARDFTGGKDSCASVFWKVLKPLAPDEYQKYLEGGRFMAAVLEDKWYTAKGDSSRMDAVLDAGLRQIAHDLYEFHQREFKGFLTAWFALSNIHGLAVIKRIEEISTEYKSRNNLLHISDFQRRVSEFISEESPDYLYWRLGEKYKYFLLDEFQDTSTTQWQNLLPLFEHLVSGGHEKGCILLVGDSRQAIYRWRGGKVELLEHHAPEFLGAQPRLLDTNYRSGESIVSFNNAFFGEVRGLLRQHPLLHSIYQGVEQKIKPGMEGRGYVRVELIDPKDSGKDAPLIKTLETIRQLLLDGFALRDICILVRQKEEGSRVADYLVSEGISVVSSDSLLLYKHAQVAFIVNAMTIIADPANRIARAAVMYYLRSAAALSPDTPEEQLLPPQFLALLKHAGRLSLYELAEELVRIFALNHGTPAFIQRFLDVVLEYSVRNSPGIAGFLEWWEERKTGYSLAAAQGSNAVEILTIHKSKGLQFPVVIMPFVNWRMKPNMESMIWVSSGDEDKNKDKNEFPQTFLVAARDSLKETQFAPDWQDELERNLVDNVNLLYVALTRAEERMYLLVSGNLKKDPDREQLATTSDLVRVALQADVFTPVDAHLYEWGIPIPRKPDDRAPEPPLNAFPANSWRSRIRIERASRKLWDSEGSTSPPAHQVMAMVLAQLSEARQLQVVLNAMAQTGRISEAEARSYGQEWSALLREAPLADWFASGIQARTQAAFGLPRGEVWKVDRLIHTAGSQVVIMFTWEKEKGEAVAVLRKTLKAIQESGGESAGGWIYLTDRKTAVQV